jgi:hypothetical protein
MFPVCGAVPHCAVAVFGMARRKTPNKQKIILLIEFISDLSPRENICNDGQLAVIFSQAKLPR